MENMFLEGGVGMYPTLLCGLAAVAAAIRYGVSPEKGRVPLIVSLGLMTAFAGGLGFVLGVAHTFQAVARVEGSSTIAMVGVAESSMNLVLALILLLCAAAASSIGAARASWTGAPRRALDERQRAAV